MDRGKAMANTAEKGSGPDGGRRIPWRLIGWGGAAGLLLVPLVAMQFTEEVDWSPFDFVFMGSLFAMIGLGLEFAVRRTSSMAYRIGAGLALMVVFLLFWFNGAVGIIGSENEDANLLFAAVIAVAVIGTVLARGRPAGMARTMLAAAGVQLFVPVAAWVLFPAAHAAILQREVFVLTAVFTGVWLFAAWLFRRAARRG